MQSHAAPSKAWPRDPGSPSSAQRSPSLHFASGLGEETTDIWTGNLGARPFLMQNGASVRRQKGKSASWALGQLSPPPCLVHESGIWDLHSSLLHQVTIKVCKSVCYCPISTSVLLWEIQAFLSFSPHILTWPVVISPQTVFLNLPYS